MPHKNAAFVPRRLFEQIEEFSLAGTQNLRRRNAGSFAGSTYFVSLPFSFFLFPCHRSEADAESHHQRTATVQAWTRTRVARGAVRVAVCDALDVVHREPVLVLRSGRVRGDRR